MRWFPRCAVTQKRWERSGVLSFIFEKLTYLAALGLSWHMRDLFSCGMWDLVPQPGIEPAPLALGV